MYGLIAYSIIHSLTKILKLFNNSVAKDIKDGLRDFFTYCLDGFTSFALFYICISPYEYIVNEQYSYFTIWNSALTIKLLIMFIKL